MPVWPFLMGFTGLLALAGCFLDAWRIPTLALGGYVLMRVMIESVPPQYHEVAGCTLWLIVAALMAYNSGSIPAFFFALSALTYPLFLVVGYRIEYFGPVPVIADGFAIAALISIGVGLGGVALNTGLDRSGLLAWISGHSLGVALR